MNIQPGADADFVVGVDLGGTNVRAALVDRNEKILGQARRPSDAKYGAAKVVEQVALTVQEAVDHAHVPLKKVGAVGVAVPGHIDPHSGMIHWSPNFGETIEGTFRIFLEVPFTDPVSQALDRAVYAGNDANIAALGEFRYGAGRNANDMVMFTLGTGIGSGVISEGRLISGSTGGAVELGHHVIVVGGQQCSCGTFGCLEAYCGTHAILERALRALESNRETRLIEKIGGDKTTLTPKMIDEAAQENDPVALEIFAETGYYLGIGIGNAVNIFNPEIVVLGGGIREATGLLAAAERSMRNHTIHSIAHTCRIVEAVLGEDAGVLGAAALAWRKIEGKE